MIILFPLPTKSQANTNLVTPVPSTPLYSIDQAPTQSLEGNITSLSGSVSWRSRSATDSSPITKPQTIHQGEGLETGDNGTAQVSFDKIGEIYLSSKTKIDFSQTLPINLVISLSSGTAKFTKSGNTPISIRALHLLTQVDSGETTVSLDSDHHLVTVLVNSGSSTLAWTDLDDNTQVVNLIKGKRFIFNDDKRK